MPGGGVGAFWSREWEGKWAVVNSDDSRGNWRIYLVEDEGKQCLLGVLYALHKGQGEDRRMAFYKKFTK